MFYRKISDNAPFFCRYLYLFTVILSSQSYWHIRLKSTAYFLIHPVYMRPNRCVCSELVRATGRRDVRRIVRVTCYDWCNCRLRLRKRTYNGSGVTGHRQPRQCRGGPGPQNGKGVQSDPNYVSRLLLDCVPVFHKIITPAYLLYRSGPVAIY